MIVLAVAHSWVEDIDGLDSCLPCLLEAKHQVDPLVEIPRYKVTLQGLGIMTNTFHRDNHVLRQQST